MADERKRTRKTHPKSGLDKTVSPSERSIGSMEKRFQKRVDFILEQQGQLVANQERAGERLERLEKIVANSYVDMRDRYNALVDAQLRTETNLNSLVEAQARTEEVVDALIDSQERLQASHERLQASHERMAETQERLAETQARTSEDLRNLIAVVDRRFSEGR